MPRRRPCFAIYKDEIEALYTQLARDAVANSDIQLGTEQRPDRLLEMENAAHVVEAI